MSDKKEECIKWCCDLIGWTEEYLGKGVDYKALFEDEDIAILIKAMWAINREKGLFRILSNDDNFCVLKYSKENGEISGLFNTYYYFKQHNNSELEALTQALIYIYENKTT